MNNVYNRTFKANGCISMFFKKEINFSGFPEKGKKKGSIQYILQSFIMSTQIYGYGNSEKRFFLFECFKVSIKEQ